MIGIDSLLTELLASASAAQSILIKSGQCTEKEFSQARLSHFSRLQAEPRASLDETLMTIQAGLAAALEIMAERELCTAEEVRREQIRSVGRLDQESARFQSDLKRLRGGEEDGQSG